MRTYRTFFEENYTAVKVPDGNKKGYRMEYRYIGPSYVFEQKKSSAMKKWYALCVVILGGIYAVCGTRQLAVNYVPFVENFLLLSVIPLIFEILGIVQFCLLRESLTEFTFQEITRRLKYVPMVHAFLCVDAVLFGYLYSVKGGYLKESFFVLTAYLCGAVLSVMISLSFRRIPHTRLPYGFKNTEA